MILLQRIIDHVKHHSVFTCVVKRCNPKQKEVCDEKTTQGRSDRKVRQRKSHFMKITGVSAQYESYYSIGIGCICLCLKNDENERLIVTMIMLQQQRYMPGKD